MMPRLVAAARRQGRGGRSPSSVPEEGCSFWAPRTPTVPVSSLESPARLARVRGHTSAQPPCLDTCLSSTPGVTCSDLASGPYARLFSANETRLLSKSSAASQDGPPDSQPAASAAPPDCGGNRAFILKTTRSCPFSSVRVPLRSARCLSSQRDERLRVLGVPKALRQVPLRDSHSESSNSPAQPAAD